MSDNDEGEFRGAEQPFEPCDSFKIEMIRRFIEEQNVRFGDESFSNSQAFEPPAAEAGGFSAHPGGARGVVFQKAGAAQSFAKPLFAGLGRYGAAFERGFNDLACGSPEREAGDLMDIADAYVFAERNFAGVRLLFAIEKREESGFTCAVGADQANAIAVLDGKGNLVEQRKSAEAFSDVLRNQNRRHVLSLLSRVRCDSRESSLLRIERDEVGLLHF